MTVDGIDFRIPQTEVVANVNAFASHKYNGKSALRYKLGVSILGGGLVRIQGPYPTGKYTNIKLFNKVFHLFLDLDPGKLDEANHGYVEHVDKVKCTMNMANPLENRAMQSRVRGHHKMLNGWQKKWGILSQTFATTSLHGGVFGACAVMMQLTIEKDEPLFSVEYKDKLMK
jgi:hypothetical protein